MKTIRAPQSKKRQPKSKRARCPVCFEGQLMPARLTQTYIHEENGINRPVVVQNMPVEKCTNCGETFHGPEAGRLHHLAICRVFGLLTPDEIVQLREKDLEMTQEKFAQLLGISQEKLSQCERGRYVQDRQLDHMLRLLKVNRSAVSSLKKIAEQNAEDASRKPRNHPRSLEMS